MKYSKLVDLYQKTSKHSHYQILAEPLRKLIPESKLDIYSRYEKERLDFILSHINPEGLSLVDIGGNTGFFSIELLSRGAQSALIIEGNKTHCNFVNEAVEIFGWQDRVKIHPEYMNFNDDLASIKTDITLLLNVLHHVGDDYCQKGQSLNTAKNNIIESLNRLANHTKLVVFQLGFNWKGNVSLPLFQGGTKKELINFIESGVQKNWSIEHIGIPVGTKNHITYKKKDADNIKRQDDLGEFLNRPIFIMKSKLQQ